MAVVTTNGQPGRLHAESFETIINRWHELWPEFRHIVAELMSSYGRKSANWKGVNCVYIHTPAEAIVEGAEWSIGVVFSGDSTLWSLPYQGWSACAEQAQAIY